MLAVIEDQEDGLPSGSVAELFDPGYCGVFGQFESAADLRLKILL